jgi:predicted PurR-regulated permease PerM
MQDEYSQRRIESLFFYGAVILVFYLTYRVFEPFLHPLGWAGVLVVCVFPVHERLGQRFGRTRAATLSTLGVTLLLVGPALALAGGLVSQAGAAVRFLQSSGDWRTRLPAGARQGLEWLKARGFPGVDSDPVAVATAAANWAAHYLTRDAGSALRDAAGVALKVFVLLFALFFLFRDGPALVARMRYLLPFDETRSARIMAQTRDLIFASVTASLLIGIIQGMLGALAFTIVGLSSPVFWGALMGILALLPLIGAWLVWAPAALWLAAQGQYGRAAIVVIACAGVAGTLEHFVRPMLLGGRTRMNALLVLLSILGGISAFGLLGFVLGPIVVALASALLDAYTAPENSASPG